MRQLYGRGVRQQTRGHGFPVSMLIGQSPSEMDGEFQHPSRCEVSTRIRQCPGRRPQPSRASSRDRVVSPPSGGEGTALRLGQSVDRPLCDVPQRETAPVLLASPGSPGRLRGCVSPSLERPGLVRVPSLSSGRSGDRPCPRVVARRDDSGRTPLAREGVVRRPSSSTHRTTSRPALVDQPAPATPLQPLPPRHPRAEPSQVATLKRRFRKSGFLGRAARVLSGCLQYSTSRLYQSRWQIFCGWCRGRGVAPVNATVPVVLDFLIHLRHDNGLSVSAVKGYSSALNSVLALKGRDLASSREITMLLRSFSRSVNPVELRPPAWDVALVLQSLTGLRMSLYGRVMSVFWHRKRYSYWPLPWLSVSGSSTLCRIVSLIQGAGLRFPFLSSRASWQTLRIPLHLLLGLRAFLYQPYQMQEISNGRLLCPVRAVRCYLDRAAAHRALCERLFVTAVRSKKEISKTTVSFWLRKTISRAYELSGTEQPVPAPCARETCGIAPSLLFKKNFAVDQVLKAGKWRRHITFTRHYLRGLAHRSLDTFHLFPVVAAQAVV